MEIVNQQPKSRDAFIAWALRRKSVTPAMTAALERVRDSEEDKQAEVKAQAELTAALRRRARANSGLAGDQWGNTFAAFTLEGTPSERKTQIAAGQAASAFAAAYPAVKRGVAFHGEPGIGKDMLLHGITIAVLEKPRVYDVRYFYGLDIEREIMAEWQRHSDPETRTEEIMRSCDLLLIGDIHKVMGSRHQDIVHAIYRVVNQVETTGKPILCLTSNFPLSGKESIDEAFGTAFGSRLADCCEWRGIVGSDRRRITKGGE